METLDLITQYNIKAKEYALSYDVIDNHIISIIASVMMTRDGKGFKGGSFVQSIVDNDLFKAVSNADSKCYQHLKVIVAANQYSYLD